MKRFALPVVTLVLALAATNANAIIVSTYRSLAEFQAATGATSATGVLPNRGNVGTEITLGTIVLSTDGIAGSSTIFIDDRTSARSGNEIAISGDENLNVTLLGGPASAFGFEIIDPDAFVFPPVLNQPDSTFTVSLFSDTLLVGDDTFTPNGILFEFFGVAADTVFNRIEIREIVSLSGDTNDYFGEFFTAAPVPLPAALWLFGSGIGLILGWTRMRARAANYISP